MSTTYIIIGVALGIVAGGLLILFRHRQRDVAALFLVFGVLALAVAVTIYQVDRYEAQKGTAAALADAQPTTHSGLPAGPPPKPPVGLVMRPAMMGGPSGSAAPPAVENPYAGGNR